MSLIRKLINLNKKLEKYNKSNPLQSDRRMCKFFCLKAVKAYILQNEGCIEAKRGRLNGGTWGDEGLVNLFELWLHKKPINKYLSFESRFGQLLMGALKGVCPIEKQYKVGEYKIDWFIPMLSIAIEYDEEHHCYKKKEDGVRQKYIEEKLNCSFIRVKIGHEIDGLSKIIKKVVKEYLLLVS